MNRIYPTRINWENEPSVATPLGATNLNKMDLAVYTIDGRLVTMDAEKLSNSTAGQMIVGVAYEQSTGVITFTRFDGATSTIDLPIEMIPADFAYDATTKEFVITLKSGEEIRVSVADLVDTYIFDNSDTILANQTTSTDGKHISLHIRNHSIGDEQMQQGYLADITDNATRAKASEDNAKVSEDNAKASELLALQYKNEAFSGTPEGYEVLVGKVAENSEGLKILNSEYATSLALDTAEGGLGVNSIKGQTVKDSTGIHSAGNLGLVDLGTVNWYEYGGAYYTDSLQNNIANYLNVYIEKYPRANVPNIASMPNGSYYVNPDNKLVAIKDNRYTSVSEFKSAMNGVLLAYEVAQGSTPDKYALVLKEHNEDNTKTNFTIIPLSAPINRNNGLYDEIVKHNGKWGVLRKFGYDDLERLTWSLISNSYWRTSQIANIRLSASWSDIPNYIVAENYQPNAYGLEGIGVAPNEALVSVNNGSTTEQPIGKFIYELATPYFEPFDDQSVMYQLESYDTKTYVTTGEGLAELSVRYGKSDVAAEALRKIVVTPSEIADLVHKELIALGLIAAPQAETTSQALNEENVE